MESQAGARFEDDGGEGPYGDQRQGRHDQCATSGSQSVDGNGVGSGQHGGLEYDKPYGVARSSTQSEANHKGG